MRNKIIGYKLASGEYMEAARKIVGAKFDWNLEGLVFEYDSRWYTIFRDLKVLDIWFEPVYHTPTKRELLIDRFQKWLDTNPNKNLIAAQCATIAEEYAKEQLDEEENIRFTQLLELTLDEAILLEAIKRFSNVEIRN